MAPIPKPDEQRRRRNATVAMTRLPVTYEGPVPAWPLASPTDAELEEWAALWALPQAAAWARMRAERLVARYCRYLLKAEGGQVTVAPEVRALEDRLGLSPMSMLRLRWAVAADELERVRTAKTPTRSRGDSRRLLLAVDPSQVTPARRKPRTKATPAPTTEGTP